MAAKPKKNFIYKIYYPDASGNNILVYIGRTRQPLEDRLRLHFLAKPIIRFLDPRIVSKIEYAECKTQGDMFIYEIYYINKLRPTFNRADKSFDGDGITITIDDLIFNEYVPRNLQTWKDKFIQ